MMKGYQAIVWAVMITPIVLIAVLFAVSWSAGLVGLGFVIAVATLYFGVGYLGQRSRRLCPACNLKRLKCINWFRSNPPPNFAYYRCDACGAEFVQIGGQPGYTERSESPFRDDTGWESTED